MSVRELRFGVRDAEGRRSPYWAVKAGARRPEVFVSCEPSGRFFHVSYHGQYWHFKVLLGNREQTTVLERPAELSPGFRRMLQIQVPPGAVDWQRQAPGRVSWMPKPPEADRWTLFDLLSEDRRANRESWPGMRQMGTQLVGRILLPDGSSVVVVTWTVPGTPGAATLRADEDDKQAIIERIRAGGVRGLVIGKLEDGTPLVIESRFAAP